MRFILDEAVDLIFLAIRAVVEEIWLAEDSLLSKCANILLARASANYSTDDTANAMGANERSSLLCRSARASVFLPELTFRIFKITRHVSTE
jgi:hypothetical protein